MLPLVKYGFDAIDWRFKGFTREGNYTGTLAYTGNGSVIREMGIEAKQKMPVIQIPTIYGV